MAYQGVALRVPPGLFVGARYARAKFLRKLVLTRLPWMAIYLLFSALVKAWRARLGPGVRGGGAAQYVRPTAARCRQSTLSLARGRSTCGLM